MWRADEAFRYEYDPQEFWADPVEVDVKYVPDVLAGLDMTGTFLRKAGDGKFRLYYRDENPILTEVTIKDNNRVFIFESLGDHWSLWFEVEQVKLSATERYMSVCKWYLYGPSCGDPTWNQDLPFDPIAAVFNYIAKRYGQPNGLPWSNPASRPLADLGQAIYKGYQQSAQGIAQTLKEGFRPLVQWVDEIHRIQAGEPVVGRPRDSRLPKDYGRGHSGPKRKGPSQPRRMHPSDSRWNQGGFRDTRSLARVRSRR